MPVSHFFFPTLSVKRIFTLVVWGWFDGIYFMWTVSLFYGYRWIADSRLCVVLVQMSNGWFIYTISSWSKVKLNVNVFFNPYGNLGGVIQFHIHKLISRRSWRIWVQTASLGAFTGDRTSGASRQGPHKMTWRVAFGPRALCLTPVVYIMRENH